MGENTGVEIRMLFQQSFKPKSNPLKLCTKLRFDDILFSEIHDAFISISENTSYLVSSCNTFWNLFLNFLHNNHFQFRSRYSSFHFIVFFCWNSFDFNVSSFFIEWKQISSAWNTVNLCDFGQWLGKVKNLSTITFSL